MRKLLLMFTWLFCVVAIVSAQTKQISGTVYSSEDGGTLPGVTIQVKGTTLGTISDADGKYSIQVPDDATALTFSFVGMQPQDVEIAGKTTIDVTLKPSQVSIDEVVVTALGIKRSEKSLGYSTQAVAGEQLNEAPEANLVNSLSGRIAGVQITNSSGAVGSSSRIILRGATSIYGNVQPLFIVDGVPISNDNDGTTTSNGGFDLPNGVADLDPNSIETINVLKGPNAAALYGIRASNGVIVITTKKGEKSKALGVEINQTITFEEPLVLPDFQNSYGQGSSKDFFQYINGTSGDGGVDESWGPPLDIGLNFMQFTSYINNPDNPQPEPWVSHPNNVRDFYETGVTSKTNVALSGGSETTTFRIDAGYSDQKGMIPFTDFKKVNVNVAGTHDLSEKLHANFGFKFINSSSDNLPNSGYDGSNVVQQTIWSGRNVDLQALKDWRNLPTALPGSTYGAGTLPISWNTAFQNNPYWQLEVNKNVFNKNRYIGNVGLSYDITNWLSASGHFGMDNYVTKTSVRWAKGSAGDAPTYWRFGSAFNRSGQDGFYDEDETSFSEYNSDFMLNFNKAVNSDFKLVASLGVSRMHRKTTWDYRAVQLELPDLYNLGNMKAGTSMVSFNNHGQSEINSVFGTAELAFKEYLFLSATGRNDWASVLPLNNNSFFYPSVNLSAVLTDALQIESSTLTYLKVRGGWAEVGGFGPLGVSDILPVYSLSSSPWGSTTFGQFPTTLNNTNIKPQTQKSLEGGLELKMFRNRLWLNFTYYNSTSTDLVIPVQVSSASGVSSVWDNIGEISNKGVEIELGGTVIEAQDFSVDLNINFAKNNNMVIKAGKDDENNQETLVLGGQWYMNLEAREGYPYGVIVGTGLERSPSGEVIFENGLPVATAENIVLGDIQPDWTGGINLDIKYKGLSLNTLVDAKMGGDVYSMTTTWGRTAGVLKETLLGRETGLVGEGVMLDGDGNYVPNNVVVSAENYNHNTYTADIVETSVFDASYIKLRQVALSYNLPKSLVTKIGLQGVSVSLIGRNLALLYKKAPHIDPETGFDSSNGLQGMEFGQLPSARSIGAGLNVKF
ncbi:SusC/RagA family TonB-linked outer membrane protein [Saccharicrinis sp. FJH2]|uniref:SusC/RagA family TonB-linked outer membrane protein n=1 Tax=Saccharicrinis sp. FJH65 TaxID=3344659 RepID=UPI0035F3D458